jgi:hypothetical protein
MMTETRTVIHDDPELEEMRLEGVRRGIFDPELPTDPKTYREDMATILIDDLLGRGLKRTVALETSRMPHPEGRTPYSTPRPGARKKTKRK